MCVCVCVCVCIKCSCVFVWCKYVYTSSVTYLAFMWQSRDSILDVQCVLFVACMPGCYVLCCVVYFCMCAGM